jgi:hypothetical protein
MQPSSNLQLLAFARMPPTEKIDDGAPAAAIASRPAGPPYTQLWFLVLAAMVIGVALSTRTRACEGKAG